MSADEFASKLRNITGEHHPELCHQCGKCSSGCPVSSFLDFRPRRIVAMDQLGMIEELVKSEIIWQCAQCLTCKERCPREVAPYDVIQALQNLAFSYNFPLPEGYSALIDSILKNGVVQNPMRVRAWKQPPTKDTKRVEYEPRDRASLNLPQPKKPDDMNIFAQALKKALKGEKK
ncbi:4Fe-4S dicluster domain-containing protein [Candidatus Bathyarchaeota archaeon]|nr:4Fe-4S dicluster domain-containing protein [Candidatus Bathyarchaeota archaeon]